jgi:hypothetical protein
MLADDLLADDLAHAVLLVDPAMQEVSLRLPAVSRRDSDLVELLEQTSPVTRDGVSVMALAEFKAGIRTDDPRLRRGFVASVKAREGLLLGGVTKVQSSPFSTFRAAVHWSDAIIEGNLEAGREPVFDGIFMVTCPAARVIG